MEELEDRVVPARVTATLTADNHYGLFHGKADGSDLSFVGRNEVGHAGAPGTYNWSLPETHQFDVAAGDHLYLAAWDDGVVQMWIGEFRLAGGGSLFSNTTSWEYTIAGINPGPDGAAPSLAEVRSAIAGATWLSPTASAAQGTSPWGTIPNISTDAEFVWADTLAEAAASDDRYVIFRTVAPVCPVNRPPEAADDVAATDEDTPLRLAASFLLANDADPDGDPLRLTQVPPASDNGGTVRLDDNGTPADPSDDVVIYTPPPHFAGTDTFEYHIRDSFGWAGRALVTVTVRPVEDDLSATLTADNHYGLFVGQADGSGLVFVGRNEVGTAGSPGEYNWSLPETYHFPAQAGDHLYVVVWDDGGPQMWAGQFSLPGGGNLYSNTADWEYFVAGSNPGPSGPVPALSDLAAVIAGAAWAVPAASVPQGSLPWGAIPGLSPAAAFVWHDTLDADSASDARYVIFRTARPLNRRPELASLTPQVVDEGMELTFTATATDPDLPPQSLTFSLVGAPEGARIDPVTGAFRWTPGETQGPRVYTFAVRVSDGGNPRLFDEKEVTVTVNEVDNPPVLAPIGPRQVDEGSELTFTASATDLDVVFQVMTFSLIGAPEGASIGAGTGVFHWTPSEAQGPGTYTFVVRVSDSTNPSSFSEQPVTVTVNETNSPPVLSAISAKEVDEESELTFAVNATDPDPPPQPLTYSLIGAPAGASIGADTGVFRWTPTEAQGPGTYDFQVHVSDGQATASQPVRVTVREVNRPPVLAPLGNRTVAEGTLLTFTATATDPDIPVQSLSFSLAPGAPEGAALDPASGVFTWTPTEAQGPGVYSVTVRVTDSGSPPLADSETILITVTEVNRPPVANADAYGVHKNRAVTVPRAAGVLANDTDADQDPLTAVLEAGPANGTLSLNPDGSFRYAPSLNFVGTDSFTYRASDGAAASELATVTLLVHDGNNPPVASPDSYAVRHDRVLVVGGRGVLANDADPDNDPLTAELLEGPTHGTLALEPDGSFRYTPRAGFVGSDSFRYRASDGSVAGNETTATIHVTNDVPVAVNDTYSVVHDRTLTVAAPGILGNDGDADGDGLRAVLIAAPRDGTLTLAPSGSFTYTPRAGFVGFDRFTYQASDGLAGSNSAEVTLAVINRPPVLTVPGPHTVREDQLLTFTVSATDPDGDSLTYGASGLPEGATFDPATRTFSWVPNCDQVGTHVIEFTATDTLGAVGQGSTTVSVPGREMPQPGAYRGGPDAAALFNAMHGGLTGWGTDEDAIYRTLEGKTPEQIAAIRRAYQDHYGRDLDADLRDELSGNALARAESLLSGSRAAADAVALNQAIAGPGTDEDAIFRTLQGKTPAELAAIQQEYQRRFGESLEDALRGDLSGAELDRALRLLEGNRAAAAAAALNQAIAGAGTDEDAIFRTLQGKSPPELAAIQQEYRQRYGESLEDALRGDLSGGDLDRALGLLESDQARADAGRLRAAMEGAGTDENEVWQTLDGTSAAHRAAIQQAYRERYGVELREDIEGDFSGPDLERTLALLEHGCLTDAQRLFYAVEGAGTDEETIRQVLNNRSKEDIDRIKEAYQRRYGRDLEDDLRGDLTGRDEFDALQALKGRPTSPAEALERLKEVQAFERANPFGNFVTGFNGHGARLDEVVDRAMMFHQQAMADGRLDSREAERLAELIGYGHDDVETFRQAQDAAADAFGTTLATVAGVAVVFVSAGAGTPVAVMLVALKAGGAGALAQVLGQVAISGQTYDVERLPEHIVTGLANGATAALTFGNPAITNTYLGRILQGAKQGLLEGAAGGFVGGIIGATVRDGTWDDGFFQGLVRAGEEGLLSAFIGGLAGGALNGLWSALPNCFPAGTLVATPDGPRLIETITTDDYVWAYDFRTSVWAPAPVLEPLARQYLGEVVTIGVQGGQVVATADHPFWVVSGTGLVSRPAPQHVAAGEPDASQPGRWVDAGDLRAGDLLQLRSGQVVSVDWLSARVESLWVYNLHVAGLHNYAVGEDEFLVHNRVPREGNRGTWMGTRNGGSGTWRSTDPNVIAALSPGAPHVDITFTNGSPDFSPYRHVVRVNSVDVVGEVQIKLDVDPNVSRSTRSNRDFATADEEFARLLNAQGSHPSGRPWRARDVADLRDAQNLTWHHHEDTIRMQLVPSDLNGNIAHRGGRAEMDQIHGLPRLGP